jgi:hypothetical protein
MQIFQNTQVLWNWHSGPVWTSFVSCICCIHAILYSIFDNFVHETKLHSVEFSTCNRKKLQIFNFWI